MMMSDLGTLWVKSAKSLKKLALLSNSHFRMCKCSNICKNVFWLCIRYVVKTKLGYNSKIVLSTVFQIGLFGVGKTTALGDIF